MSQFELEDRYLVIKRKDLEKIPDHLRHEILNAVAEADLPTREYVVVEKDWPEYQPTLDSIKKRVESQ
ncbi:hypothetical protein [Pseudomonas phage 98PfluR60PP]|uniref:Uncharacterized protein n=1 Tax=Pseudomonas phage 98PfluR60PP TaxID=2163965 RepID=A0A2S1PFX0_9CAUD|nr:hypothetical protein PP760_gp32 [Pseudomonas phage 98PfluR60PP]AWH15464.1 hypothetical protein [Pseudomonas phage 98PfluR60PP]